MSQDVFKMASLGLGTFKSSNDDVYQAVTTAINKGYRAIDTASIYGNEQEIGRAIGDNKISRREVCITTKIWNDVKTYNDAIIAVEESMQRLNVEYIDLVLIHWPLDSERNYEVWKALEYLLEKNVVLAIGVSNFQIHHLDELLSQCSIVPMMNQVEMHPYLTQNRLKSYMDEAGIAMTSYGPFAKNEIANDELLLKLGRKYDRTVYQIVLKWGIQRGIFMIPKSITDARIIENFEIFDFKLTMDEVNSITKLNKGRRLYTDPDNVPY